MKSLNDAVNLFPPSLAPTPPNLSGTCSKCRGHFIGGYALSPPLPNLTNQRSAAASNKDLKVNKKTSGLSQRDEATVSLSPPQPVSRPPPDSRRSERGGGEDGTSRLNRSQPTTASTELLFMIKGGLPKLRNGSKRCINDSVGNGINLGIVENKLHFPTL